jgi:ADP-heptose:LPS heptosyltransferase
MKNFKKRIKLASEPRKIIFRNFQSPGDIIMLSSAVRDLKLSHKDILIDVRTACGAIWENNPHLTKFNENDEGVEIIKTEYPLIHTSNEGQHHFIHGFRKDMEDRLGLEIEPTIFKGDIHISDEEKSWMSQIEEMGIKDKFWIINAGIKYDFTAKAWNPASYQKIVDNFKDKITFVQIGEKGHFHPPLNNVVNLIGKTNLRELIRLVYHSVGVICPVTLMMHLAAAVECKHDMPNRPCVVLAGGREPSQWEKYPHHRFLETNGALKCCDNGGCWKSRCSKVGDGDNKDLDKELCLHSVETDIDFKGGKLKIAKCLDMIKPEDVIRSIEMYYEGGVLEYNK